MIRFGRFAEPLRWFCAPQSAWPPTLPRWIASERSSAFCPGLPTIAEQELTVVVQMLQKLCEHVGVDVKSANQQVQGFRETAT